MMKDSKLDRTRFFPCVLQAVSGKDYVVYAYMNDGSIRLLDMKPLIRKGGVFEPLKDEKLFCEKLTVMNHTVAWDMGGNRDETRCIDIDPFTIFEGPAVSEIPDSLQEC